MLSLERRYEAPTRHAVPRRRLHRRAVPRRALRRLRGTCRTSKRRLPLRRPRPRPAAARRGDFRQVLVDATGAEPAHRAAPVDARVHQHLLAQRLEVPGARLPPLLLGRRHDAGQSASPSPPPAPSRPDWSSASPTAPSTACSPSTRPRRRPLCLVALGRARRRRRRRRRSSPLHLPTQRLSPSEVDYPAIARCTGPRRSIRRRGGGLARAQASSAPAADAGADLVPLAPPPTPATRPIEEVIRAAARRAASPPIRSTSASSPRSSTRPRRHAVGRGGDFRPSPDGRPLTDLYLIVNAVEGLASGAYLSIEPARALAAAAAGRLPPGGRLPRPRPGAGGRRGGERLLPGRSRARSSRASATAATAPRSSRRRSRAASSTSPPTRSASAPPASPSSTTT